MFQSTCSCVMLFGGIKAFSMVSRAFSGIRLRFEARRVKRLVISLMVPLHGKFNAVSVTVLVVLVLLSLSTPYSKSCKTTFIAVSHKYWLKYPTGPELLSLLNASNKDGDSSRLSAKAYTLSQVSFSYNTV